MIEKGKVRVVNTRTNKVRYVTEFVADSAWMKKQGWQRQELPNTELPAVSIVDEGANTQGAPAAGILSPQPGIIEDNNPAGNISALPQTTNDTTGGSLPETQTVANTNAPASGPLTTTGPGRPPKTTTNQSNQKSS